MAVEQRSINLGQGPRSKAKVREQGEAGDV